MTERTDEFANEVAAKVAADELQQAVEEEAEAEAATAPAFEVILASSSPRRRELLDAAGVKFTVRTPATPVDESLEPDLAADPEEAAKKLAERKAGAVIQEVLAENYTGMLIVIGADTMVVLDGKIFGKPRSASDGKHMLRQLSGRTHEVITAVSVWMVAAPQRRGCVSGLPHLRRHKPCDLPRPDRRGNHRLPAQGRVLRQGRRLRHPR